ncbi:MAG: hypothetical protein ACFFFC_00285 [Candidatus Thorarchaeota archaeon]
MNGKHLAYELLYKEGAAARTIAKHLIRTGRGAAAAGKGFLQSGKLISKHMEQAGVKSPLAHGVAQASPYLLALYGGKKAYESPTGQKLRYKVQEWKARKAMERMQGGY